MDPPHSMAYQGIARILELETHRAARRSSARFHRSLEVSGGIDCVWTYKSQNDRISCRGSTLRLTLAILGSLSEPNSMAFSAFSSDCTMSVTEPHPLPPKEGLSASSDQSFRAYRSKLRLGAAKNHIMALSHREKREKRQRNLLAVKKI